jgi:predicted transcriptional regulator
MDELERRKEAIAEARANRINVVPVTTAELIREVRDDADFMDGVREGLEACKQGKVYPLEDVIRDLAKDDA